MDKRSIQNIFKSFNKVKALVIGDVMLDSYVWGKVERISPEAPVPVVRVEKREDRLGGAANVALNIKALGAEPILCAVAGSDDGGKKLIRSLKANRLSTDGVIVSRNRPTTIKTRVISGNHHIVRVDEELDKSLTKGEEKRLMAKVEKYLPRVQVIIFEDYDKGVLSENLISKIVGLATMHSVPTVVDPKKRNFHFYKNVTLFKPNLKELREGLKQDVDPRNTKQVMEVVAKLKEELNAAGALVTLSGYGVYIDFKGEKSLWPAHKREITDVSGAGDTVVSIAALAIALHLKPRTIATLSNLGGGLVCQYVGVVPIDKTQLLNESLLALKS